MERVVNNIYFSPCWRWGSPRPRCRQTWFLTRALFRFVDGQLLTPSWHGWERALVSFSSCKETNSITRAPLSWQSHPQGPTSKYHMMGIRVSIDEFWGNTNTTYNSYFIITGVKCAKEYVQLLFFKCRTGLIYEKNIGPKFHFEMSHLNKIYFIKYSKYKTQL